MKCHWPCRAARLQAGATLAETLISLAIAVVTISGTVNGYIFSTTRAEWSAYSLAAHSLANQRMEQTRAAKWDTGAYPSIDLVVSTNFPTITNILDIPVSGTNVTLATCFTTVRSVSLNPPVKFIQVDCVWPFRNGRLYTNTLSCYRAPDQ